MYTHFVFTCGNFFSNFELDFLRLVVVCDIAVDISQLRWSKPAAGSNKVYGGTVGSMVANWR